MIAPSNSLDCRPYVVAALNGCCQSWQRSDIVAYMGNTSLAELLRTSRSERGESVRAAARNLGVAASHLSRVESGERRPSQDLRRQLSDYYGIADDDLQLAAGAVPDDVIEILRRHPELIDRLRSEYGQPD